jgi:hypothetical protein
MTIGRSMSNFRTIDRQTGFLLPPSVDEWLPEEHLARFVVEVVEGLPAGDMTSNQSRSDSRSRLADANETARRGCTGGPFSFWERDRGNSAALIPLDFNGKLLRSNGLRR